MEKTPFDRGPKIVMDGHSRGEAIFVTRPFLPPLEEFEELLKGIWERGILTNNGPLNCRFEQELEALLGTPSVATVSNGSIALELALEASGVSGEVITTPYSFVATSHSILRRGLTPVFADVEHAGFNIDPDRVEAAITPDTCAIIAVHCYGYPCALGKLDEIAKARGLTLIYDAAHAFGVRSQGRSVFEFGDYSTLSFHATKVVHTFEGGAIAVSDPEARVRLNSLRNFGIENETTIPYVGTNAKLSEVGAAMGLVQLRHFAALRTRRAEVDRRYRDALRDVDGIVVPPCPEGVEHNYSYFPILVTDTFPISRDELYNGLKKRGIFTRRYFYPLLSSLPMYRDLPSASIANLPVANALASQVLCLPIYDSLRERDVERIVGEMTALAR